MADKPSVVDSSARSISKTLFEKVVVFRSSSEACSPSHTSVPLLYRVTAVHSFPTANEPAEQEIDRPLFVSMTIVTASIASGGADDVAADAVAWWLVAVLDEVALCVIVLEASLLVFIDAVSIVVRAREGARVVDSSLPEEKLRALEVALEMKRSADAEVVSGMLYMNCEPDATVCEAEAELVNEEESVISDDERVGRAKATLTSTEEAATKGELDSDEKMPSCEVNEDIVVGDNETVAATLMAEPDTEASPTVGTTVTAVVAATPFAALTANWKSPAPPSPAA